MTGNSAGENENVVRLTVVRDAMNGAAEVAPPAEPPTPPEGAQAQAPGWANQGSSCCTAAMRCGRARRPARAGPARSARPGAGRSRGASGATSTRRRRRGRSSRWLSELNKAVLKYMAEHPLDDEGG